MANEGGSGRRSDVELFSAAAAAVARSDDLDDALAELVGLAAERLGAASGAAYLLDQDRDELELTVTLGVEPALAAAVSQIGPIESASHPLANAMRERRPTPIADAAAVAQIAALAPGSQATVLLPLVVRRDGIELALGLLVLGFAGPLPEPAELAAVEPIADLAAVAVERAVALSLDSERGEWFARLAHTDPLTGLANRRTFDRMLELELARAARQGVPVSLMVFLVDGFAAIQRGGGKAAGDEALRRIAQVLAESVRLVDTVARYAGEEFALVAPGPDGRVVAERLVRTIAALPPLNGIAIGVSAGVATFPADGRGAEELLAAAEHAAGTARAAGGGRTATPADEGAG